MGNLNITTGWPRGSRSALRCRGFANTQLIIALAILVVVGLLVQLQTCERIPFSGDASVKKASGAKRPSKAPALIPPAPEAQVLAQAENKFITQRQNEVARIDRMQRETIEAYARMDGRRAAQILGELDPLVAVEILAKLRERDIARILEEADPAIAATWTGELLKKPEFEPVPDLLKNAAARAGLYDDLPDLLGAAGEPTDSAAATGAEPNTDTTTDTGTAGEAQPTAPGAAEGTAAPEETANPAAGPPPQGDATTEQPPAESIT